MSRWRHEALRRLPELRKTITSAESVGQLWIDLHLAFEKAYEQDPRNEGLIAAIYSYADWCLAASSTPDGRHDPAMSVVTVFYEDIPTHRAARDDMPRWFSYTEVAQSKSVFAYSIGEQKYEELLAYMAKNRKKYIKRDNPEQPKS